MLTLVGISFANVELLDSETTVFVVDVQTLGTRSFSRDIQGLRDIIGSSSIMKVTFDCRGDSDALFHQFDVTLRGVP